MSTNLARIDQAPSALARPGIEFDRGQLDLIKQQCAQKTSDNEFALFVEVCRQRGLNPMTGQVYAIVRNDKNSPNGTKMTIQVGIDGLRAIAERSGEYAGQTATEWCGPDGVWKDIWLSKEPPAAARVGVRRRGYAEPTYGVAMWDEYAPYKDEWSNGKKTGGKALEQMWQQRPAGQLAKCAEALALRKAFPQDMSGLYAAEEMAQADNPTTEARVRTHGMDLLDDLKAIAGTPRAESIKAHAAAHGKRLTAQAFDADPHWLQDVAILLNSAPATDVIDVDPETGEIVDPMTEPF